MLANAPGPLVSAFGQGGANAAQGRASSSKGCNALRALLETHKQPSVVGRKKNAQLAVPIRTCKEQCE